MKSSVRIAALFLVLAALQGCASTRDIPTSTYSQPAPDGETIVYFYRDATMPTRANLDVKIDGKKVALLPPNRFTWIKVRPGRHALSVGYPSTPDMSAKFELIAEVDKIYVFKYLSSAGGGIVPLMGPGGALIGTMQMGSRPWTRLVQEAESTLPSLMSSHEFVTPQID